MFKLFKKRAKNQKGFTLIELIVVIAIIGILGAIAIPRVTGFQESARKGTDVANAKTIANIVATLVAAGTSGFSDDMAAFDAATNANITNAIQTPATDLVCKTTTVKDEKFMVVVVGGKITIYANTNDAAHQLYPTPGSTFK